MIADRTVFDDSYRPQELLHREGEVGQLIRAFCR